MKGHLLFWISGLYLAQASPFALCPAGYSIQNIGGGCYDTDECAADRGICGKWGICWNLEGSYMCQCPTGLTTSGSNQTQCPDVNCDQYITQSIPEQTLPGFNSIISVLRDNCLMLNKSGMTVATNETFTVLTNVTDSLQLLFSGVYGSSEVTTLLKATENLIRLMSPLLRDNVSRINTSHTEIEIVVIREKTPPQGPVKLTNENIQLDTTWETVIGKNYPGFGFAVLLSYKSLQILTNISDKLSSRVVTVSVSNPNITNLSEPIILTFKHLTLSDQNATCVYWSEVGGGAWSSQGCTLVVSNSTHTVCSCTHLSSFALLSEMQKMKEDGKISLVMSVCVSVAFALMVLSLLTALWCRFMSKKHNGGRQRLQRSNLKSTSNIDSRDF